MNLSRSIQATIDVLVATEAKNDTISGLESVILSNINDGKNMNQGEGSDEQI